MDGEWCEVCRRTSSMIMSWSPLSQRHMCKRGPTNYSACRDLPSSPLALPFPWTRHLSAALVYFLESAAYSRRGLQYAPGSHRRASGRHHLRPWIAPTDVRMTDTKASYANKKKTTVHTQTHGKHRQAHTYIHGCSHPSLNRDPSSEHLGCMCSSNK